MVNIIIFLIGLFMMWTPMYYSPKKFWSPLAATIARVIGIIAVYSAFLGNIAITF